MAERHTEVTTRSYGERMAGSLGGVVFGLLLFVLAFPLLYWNEGRAARALAALDEGAGTVVSVAADRVDPANDGRLIHLSGPAEPGEGARDDAFGIHAPGALRLRRTVEMYQWQEHTETRTTPTAGGGERRETTYDYRRGWFIAHIDSAHFRHPDGHANPALPYHFRAVSAEGARLGAYALPPSLLVGLQNLEPFAADPAAGSVAAGYTRHGEHFYSGAPEAPRVGDLRLRFEIVPAGPVTVVAEQTGTTLKPFSAASGRSLFLIAPGRLSLAQLFADEERRESWMTWALRLFGLLLLYGGVALILGPLTVVSSIVPALESLVGAGTALVALVIVLPLWLLTMAAGWLAHRPLTALLLAAAGLATSAAIVLLRYRRAGNRAPA